MRCDERLKIREGGNILLALGELGSRFEAQGDAVPVIDDEVVLSLPVNDTGQRHINERLVAEFHPPGGITELFSGTRKVRQ